MTRDFHTLTVMETREEIGGHAKTVMFDVPEALRDVFAWRAGQHLSFRFQLDGQDVRRSYSISSSPVSGEALQITVKRVKNGLVSNYINDHVKKGDRLEVMPPFGAFCLDASSKLRRTHYFFGAGSGITPLYAMLHSVLVAEPYSFVHLVYGNRNANSIIFHDSLNRLLVEYPERLTVHHILSKPSIWSGFQYWRKGMIDKAAIEALIAENPPYAQDTQYYICGPGGMNRAVKETLMGLDVPATRIHMESYGGKADVDDSVKGQSANLELSLNGTTRTVTLEAEQTVLEAVREAGLEPPFSCESGVCGACRAKLNEGSVHMRARMALTDRDIQRGSILTCQSVATSDTLNISYE